MTVNAKIISALKPLGLPVKPDRYAGNSESYFVFIYSTIAAGFADNAPSFERYLVQIHYFSPMGVNTLSMRSSVKRLLFASGFTWPEEINAGDGSIQKNDENKQHYIFECELVEGLEDGEI